MTAISLDRQRSGPPMTAGQVEQDQMARLDGQLVVYVDQRLSVEALRQRMAAGARRAQGLARVSRHP